MGFNSGFKGLSKRASYLKPTFQNCQISAQLLLNLCWTNLLAQRPPLHKNTPTWDGSNNDLFIPTLKYAIKTVESYIAPMMYYYCEVINRKKSAVHYLAAQYRKSSGSIQGIRRTPARTEFPRSGSKRRTPRIKDTQINSVLREWIRGLAKKKKLQHISRFPSSQNILTTESRGQVRSFSGPILAPCLRVRLCTLVSG